MTDEFDAPLKGRKKRQWPRFGNWRAPAAGIALAVVVIGGAGLVAFVFTTPPAPPQATAEIAETPAPAPAPAEPEPEVTITPVEPAGEQSIIIVDDALEEQAAEDAGDASSTATVRIEPTLLEATDNGPIPRIGPDGHTAFQAYARAGIGEVAAGKPRLAIIVTGLGLNAGTTNDAIAALPGAVTLAFAPYGGDLQTATERARADGHEIMLQVPLEPFGYPQTDPGPNTLVTGDTPADNRARLHWLMARFTGYFGVINHLGARFTAAAADFAPVIEELAARGLSYVDDGSSNRSLAAGLAAANALPFARADTQLDADPSRAAILSALEGLKTRAIENKSAIGVISALPISVTTVAEWLSGLEDEGVLLVPVSSLMHTN